MSAFIEEHRARFGVEPICSTLGVSASAYYQRATGERSARVVEDERLLELSGSTRRTTSPTAPGGCGRRCCATASGSGAAASQRLMRAHGIQGAKRRGKPWRTTTADPAAARHPDLVNRDFTAPGAGSSCGWRTSRICAAGRASCSSAS